MGQEKITDEKLFDLLKVFFAHPEDILDKEHKDLDINNIMMGDTNLKRKFITHLTQKYLTFSHNKNMLVYHEVMQLLGLESRIRLRDLIKEKERKESIKLKGIVHIFLDEFWDKVELYFGEFEAILNIYWRKGIDAEISGMSKEQVMRIIDHALFANESMLRKAYYELLEKLNLTRGKAFGAHHSEFNLVEYIPIKTGFEMNENQKTMFEELEKFRIQLEEGITFLNQTFISSFDVDLELKKEGKDDNLLVKETEEKITNRWKKIEEAWKDIKEKMN